MRHASEIESHWSVCLCGVLLVTAESNSTRPNTANHSINKSDSSISLPSQIIGMLFCWAKCSAGSRQSLCVPFACQNTRSPLWGQLATGRQSFTDEHAEHIHSIVIVHRTKLNILFEWVIKFDGFSVLCAQNKRTDYPSKHIVIRNRSCWAFMLQIILTCTRYYHLHRWASNVGWCAASAFVIFLGCFGLPFATTGDAPKAHNNWRLCDGSSPTYLPFANAIQHICETFSSPTAHPDREDRITFMNKWTTQSLSECIRSNRIIYDCIYGGFVMVVDNSPSASQWIFVSMRFVLSQQSISIYQHFTYHQWWWFTFIYLTHTSTFLFK